MDVRVRKKKKVCHKKHKRERMRDINVNVEPVHVSILETVTSTMQEYAHDAMFGNRTCSIDNMNTSCFAAERCTTMGANTSHRFNSSPQSIFSGAVFTLVAHSMRKDDIITCGDDEQFVGCICVGLSSIYPRFTFPSYVPYNAHVIYNLCVSNTFQGRGVGRLLVNAARAHVSGPLYLLVLRSGTNSPDRNIANVMTERVKRLTATYSHMGLKRIDQLGNHILFQVT